MADREEVLRRLTLGDDRFLDALIDERRGDRRAGCLTPLEEALVKLGALAATDGPDQAFQQVVGAALNAGLSPTKVVDALVVLAPVIGSTHVTAVAPRLALAIGYDVVTELETR
jgi:hypothetical protein